MVDEVKIEIKPSVVPAAKLVDKPIEKSVEKPGEKKVEKVEKTEVKKRGRKPIFKPTQFDSDLMHLLREGTGVVEEITAHLGVSKTELLKRLELLKAENLATEENSVFHLTVNGYNFYAAKGIKKVSLKKTFTGEVKLHKHHKVEKRDAVPIDPEKQKHVADWLSSTEVVDLGGKLGKMDLEEIIKRYGPSQEQKERFIERKVEEVVQIKQQPKTTGVSTPSSRQSRNSGSDHSNSNDSEVCDLCKSPFKLAISDPQLAKYGHCFCGAAYHKECYDTLLADSAQCVRCGKKLFLIIDKQSREVINKIKDVFE
ncbi:MAG: hypothetical protein Q8R15_00185 [Candidatus Micrarchaeota archaeon]|nr:hypothetical protein [Candidatus Micrarchaeota archaeon]